MKAKFHHRAMAKGYVSKNGKWKENYKGRFGEGYKIHIPNCETKYVSRTYHFVDYYIY